MGALRARAETAGLQVDLAAALQGGGAETGVPCGALLIAFAEAVLGTNDAVLRSARAALRDRMGDAALVDAAATVASYNSVVKVADATGIPLDTETAEATADLREDLGIGTYTSGQKS